MKQEQLVLKLKRGMDIMGLDIMKIIKEKATDIIERLCLTSHLARCLHQVNAEFGFLAKNQVNSHLLGIAMI